MNIVNKNANRNYFIEDTIEAGISLLGSEVKPLINNDASINEAYIMIRQNEAYIYQMHIASYNFAHHKQHDPLRNRKLLMHKNEIIKFAHWQKTQRINLIPMKLFFKNNKIKLLVGIGKGKKLWDKRTDLKKRTQNLEIKKQVNSL
ncbi:SsrA-binding protein SmpB [Ureaplasma zalophigenitalium]|uniref:SsrA-binding protein n=1 Tax=Ureaplasma zalophigenitalium TaxID=907723 RepID=A0ABT3BNF9_9BACT|nr:SsrA-binding protein SmpB [Ureaplasma zalophigenitalium]MCV3753790.1 SsrA-binding protein SmpB [Ureaplasma zalophigenitalium]